MGISKEGFQEWRYVMGQNGMDISSLNAGMKTLVNQMESAAGGSKTWTLSGTAVNTAYRFYITNANAVQLTKMVLIYKKN